MVAHDEFGRREEDARDLIGALRRLSNDARISPDFLTRVMAKADQQAIEALPALAPLSLPLSARLPHSVLYSNPTGALHAKGE